VTGGIEAAADFRFALTNSKSGSAAEMAPPAIKRS